MLRDLDFEIREQTLVKLILRDPHLTPRVTARRYLSLDRDACRNMGQRYARR